MRRRASELSLNMTDVMSLKPSPYNLYCVGGDVIPCSINQSVIERWSKAKDGTTLDPGSQWLELVTVPQI